MSTKLLLRLFCLIPTLILCSAIPSPALEKLVLCQGSSLQTLYTLAQETGAFQKEGLEVEIRNFTVGLQAFDSLLAGKCDVASAAEMPLIIRSFTDKDVVVVATTRSSNDQSWVLARSDRGIRNVKDLSGRVIGIPKGTAPHFFAEQLLAKYGVRPGDYEEKYVNPSELEKLILNGEVDAIALPALQTSRIAARLGDKGVVFREPGLCLNFGILNVRRKYLEEKPKTVENLLRALLRAESHLKEYPQESRELILKANKLSPAEYDEIMRENTDAITLPNGLFLTMEDCARWAMERKIVDSRQMPNYLNFIDETILKSLAPNVVTIGR